jgi:hypothetical protein
VNRTELTRQTNDSKRNQAAADHSQEKVRRDEDSFDNDRSVRCHHGGAGMMQAASNANLSTKFKKKAKK